MHGVQAADGARMSPAGAACRASVGLISISRWEHGAGRRAACTSVFQLSAGRCSVLPLPCEENVGVQKSAKIQRSFFQCGKVVSYGREKKPDQMSLAREECSAWPRGAAGLMLSHEEHGSTGCCSRSACKILFPSSSWNFLQMRCLSPWLDLNICVCIKSEKSQS